MRSFKIEVRGHTYSGLWVPRTENIIEVRSDYGIVRCRLDGRQPSTVAREGLETIIPGPWR
jgi:hypothetical protein